MEQQTPESRPTAPGALGVVQEFMNSAHLAAGATISADIAEAIRLRHALGESQAALAAAFGISQKFVAAVARGARLADELATPDGCARWLSARGLVEGNTVLSEEDRGRVVLLRDSLRALAAGNNGHPVDAEVVATIEALAAAAPMVVRFESWSEPALQPANGGVEGAIARLLAMVFDAMRDGAFVRLKRCPGDGCPQTFYDASRNRTGTWCAMAVCGNRTKVRSYQRRRREDTRRASRASS